MKIIGLEKCFNKVLFKCEFLQINENGLYYLKGKNGSGKTTLFNLMAGIDKKYSGQITENDDVVFYKQNAVLLDYLSFKENLNMLDSYNLTLLDQLLNKLKVQHLVNFKISEISVGEKQRLEIIFCLVRKSQIYLFDEPFSSLNKEYIDIVSTYLEKISFNHIVIVSSHINFHSDIKGIIEIKNENVSFDKENKDQKGTIYIFNKRNKLDLSKLKFLIFNKYFFLLKIINLISIFLLLSLSINFKNSLYNQIEKSNYFNEIYVIEKYQTSHHLKDYIKDKNNVLCYDSICKFSLQGNKETINILNEQNPYLHFYSLENEVIEDIKIKINPLITRMKIFLLITGILSFFVFVICEIISYIINIKKHRTLKKYLSPYSKYLIVNYVFMIIISLILSKLILKFVYKKLLY